MHYNVRQERLPYSPTLVVRQQSQHLNLTRTPAVAIADDPIGIHAYVPDDVSFLNLFCRGLCRDAI